MKRYYLIRVSTSEYNSRYEKICETLEEAKKEVPNYANWWSPQGSCDIHEVDENFNTYKVYSFYDNKPNGIKVWREE